jgi:penicillin-insensitive murein endopeptidase
MRILLIGLLLFCHPSWSASQCYGTTSKGRIENPQKLPSSGPNFTSYSLVAEVMGRTYVHSTVKDIIVAAYKQLEQTQANKVFKYAETGAKSGGQFKPHKTHRNGLSVDFMVPVVDQHNQSQHLPTNLLNRWGYDLEFDHQGKLDQLTIDYEAMAAHIVALDKHSKTLGHKLWRVIFDPKLQPFLLNTSHGDYIKQHIKLSTKRSWVRHDEHYHVDFAIPCKKM